MRQFFKYYIRLFLWALFVVGCTSNTPQKEEHESFLPEDTEFDLSFGGYANGMNTSLLRADDDINGIQNLRLLVFDEHRNFLYSRVAIVGGIADAIAEGHNYLPEPGRDNIAKMRNFRAKVLSSVKPRYIHFIANHKWDDFPQDIYLRGKSDGEILGHLSTQKTEFWQLIRLDHLQPSSLNGKVVKLLRNTSQVRVVVANKTIFTLEGFVVYNRSDRANVAPFVYNKTTQEYDFPFKPMSPTVPAGTTYSQPSDVIMGESPIDLFEHENTDPSSTFVIIKGLKEGASRSGYYKVDFVDIDGNTGVSTLLPIIRNHRYVISIKDVINEGYATFAEAVSQPAGNNLFASVELSEYPKVSDGRNTLEVSNLGALYVKQGAFKARILYSAGGEHVKIYRSYEDSDPYLGVPRYQHLGGTKNPEGSLEIEIKGVPQNGETKKYRIAVVGKDPDTRSTMSRVIVLSLHKAYDFNAEITRTNSGYWGVDKEATISFSIPRDINPSVFPFDVYIYTNKLTPKNGQMLLEVDKATKRYRYKYTIRNSSVVDRPIKLDFVQNGGDQHGQVASLESDYFETQTLSLD